MLSNYNLWIYVPNGCDDVLEDYYPSSFNHFSADTINDLTKVIAEQVFHSNYRPNQAERALQYVFNGTVNLDYYGVEIVFLHFDSKGVCEKWGNAEFETLIRYIKVYIDEYRDQWEAEQEQHESKEEELRERTELQNQLKKYPYVAKNLPSE